MTDPAGRSAVHEMADRFWAGFLERDPIIATVLGDERYDDRLPDPGPEGRARERGAHEEVLRAAAAIDHGSLVAEDRATLDMLETVARVGLAQLDQHMHELVAVDQMAGPQLLPGELASFQRIDTAERVDRFVARLEAYPRYISAWADAVRDGVQSGRTPARPVVDRTISQIEAMIAAPVEADPALAAAGELDETSRDRLLRAVEQHVRPAQAAFLDVVRDAAPHARRAIGLWAVPGGDEAYATCMLAATTIVTTPRELHEFGLAELEAIDRERLAIAHDRGFGDVAAYRAALEADPANRAARPETIVDVARRHVERATAAAPRWFGRLPHAACEVHAVEPFRERDAPPAFYMVPAADGSRPGVYRVNTFDPASRPLHRLASITFHEAVPGHHFQLAIESELTELHPFRRHGSRLAGVAYTEGWGLYAERLADEIGLYDGPAERFGMLDAQGFRAARLVVDTGIHAFRWDRERAVGIMESRGGLTRLEAETETDRYIVWPGQALAYMVGQREIRALRRDLEERDGSAFDLRGFHDALLGHGSLPLATLRRELPGWVAPQAPPVTPGPA
jgi:uncharacterized protein (DUF885 family)